jgi:hypothetical protein
MTIFRFIFVAYVRATTPFPSFDVWHFDLMHRVHTTQSPPSIESLLAEGLVDVAIQTAVRQIEASDSGPTHAEISSIMQVQKARIDHLRPICRQLTRFFEGTEQTTLHRWTIASDLISNRRTLWNLCEDMFKLLLRLIELRRCSSDAELVDYHIGAANFMRYAVEQEFPDADLGRVALWHYDVGIQWTNDMRVLLMARNHKALLLKILRGERVAAQYLENELRVSKAQIEELYLSRTISMEDAVSLTGMTDVMKHNIDVWREEEEWVLV